MPTIGWNESSPPDTESAGLGDDRIRSLTTAVRTGLDGEHIWPSGGGDAGVHRIGSARAYVGPQSAVSSSGTDGRLMWTSDTSRLFHVGSGGTAYLGGPRVISVGTDTGFTYPQRHHWVEEIGLATVPLGSFSTTVTIPNSGFSGVPYVFLTQNEPGSAVYVRAGALSVTATSFQITLDESSVAHVIAWRSLGTRVL